MRDTKAQKIARFYDGMATMGIGYDTASKLRRIEMTLHRWAELECGDGNEWGSWAIERDEATDKPFMIHHHYGHGQRPDSMSRHRVADREAGALRRLARLMAEFPELTAYYQTDPRGCALYILKQTDIVGPIDSCYSRGFGVCY